jgi:hypothetical protein
VSLLLESDWKECSVRSTCFLGRKWKWLRQLDSASLGIPENSIWAFFEKLTFSGFELGMMDYDGWPYWVDYDSVTVFLENGTKKLGGFQEGALWKVLGTWDFLGFVFSLDTKTVSHSSDSYQVCMYVLGIKRNINIPMEAMSPAPFW